MFINTSPLFTEYPGLDGTKPKTYPLIGDLKDSYSWDFFVSASCLSNTEISFLASSIFLI